MPADFPDLLGAIATELQWGLLLGGMGVVMLLNRSYSFSVGFSFLAALYCAGWIRTVGSNSQRPNDDSANSGTFRNHKPYSR
jgi:hypothetical protein